jgi:fucose permease
MSESRAEHRITEDGNRAIVNLAGRRDETRTSGRRALVWLVFGLFFIWGGATSLNDVLIPKLKGLFSLSYAEVMLTQFAFFTAYFLVSIPAGTLVSRLGYVRGLVVGLGIMACGALLFWPASSSGAYWPFLVALFVLAGGITVLQVAANPLITTLGDASSASSRLTFAQAFNSLGTTICPYIGAQLILPSVAAAGAAKPAALRGSETAVVSDIYIAIAIVLALVALVFWSGLSLASCAATNWPATSPTRSACGKACRCCANPASPSVRSPCSSTSAPRSRSAASSSAICSSRAPLA